MAHRMTWALIAIGGLLAFPMVTGADSGDNDVVIDQIRKGLAFKQVSHLGGAGYDEGDTGRVFWTSDIDGIGTKIVRVRANDTAPFDVDIDPATGAFKRVVSFPDDRYERRIDEIASYADVGNGENVIGSYKSI